MFKSLLFLKIFIEARKLCEISTDFFPPFWHIYFKFWNYCKNRVNLQHNSICETEKDINYKARKMKHII